MSQAQAQQPQGGGELASWKNIPQKDVQPVPEEGTKAPTSPQIPLPNGKRTLIVFLRHCGCPCKLTVAPVSRILQASEPLTPRSVAEKSFKTLATISQEKEEINCIAVSHSSEEATERWLPQVGGTWKVNVVVDPLRDLYAQWGLGLSSTLHAVSPFVLWSVYKLGTTEGIWNRPTESGSRWQKSGAFAVDRFGNVCWKHISQSADDIPDFEEALQALLRK